MALTVTMTCFGIANHERIYHKNDTTTDFVHQIELDGAKSTLLSLSTIGPVLDGLIGITFLVLGVLVAMNIVPLPAAVTWAFIGIGIGYLAIDFIISALTNRLLLNHFTS